MITKIVWSIFNKPKKLVLFLRKFNSTELNNAVSTLSSTKFGNNYRLITLDDSDFENIGIKKTQNFLIFAFLFLIVLVLGFIATILILIYLSNQGAANAEGEADFFMRLATIAAIMLPLVFALIAMLIYNYATYRFAIYHENISVNDEKGFRLARKIATRLKKKSFTSKSKGALSTLIGSADNWWKECVEMLAGESDLIIMDISVLSESIKWEIETIQNTYPHKLILVADVGEFAETERSLSPKTVERVEVYKNNDELKSFLLSSL